MLIKNPSKLYCVCAVFTYTFVCVQNTVLFVPGFFCCTWIQTSYSSRMMFVCKAHLTVLPYFCCFIHGKKKRLVQSPNSYFMDVKCPGCYKITTVFSHAQTVVLCVGCSTVLCQPTGGKARLTEGCSFRRKQH